MKVNFGLKMIAAIIANVQQYGEMFVTTNGQMFRSEKTCVEAIRTINMIYDNYDQAVGYVKLTKTQFPTESLREIGKNPATFNKLFEEAVVPRQIGNERENNFERQVEKFDPEAKSREEAIEAALFGGGDDNVTSEAPKAEAPKAEVPKAEAPKAEAPKAEAPKAEAPKAEAPKAEAVSDTDAIKKKLGVKK